jgi:hypothetical protein
MVINPAEDEEVSKTLDYITDKPCHVFGITNRFSHEDFGAGQVSDSVQE